MSKIQINRVSVWVLAALSLTELLTVILGAFLPVLLTGHVSPPERDEGTGAHIFQLSITALVPTILLFFATADWKYPWRIARVLAFPTIAVVLAFGALYYFEHLR